MNLFGNSARTVIENCASMLSCLDTAAGRKLSVTYETCLSKSDLLRMCIVETRGCEKIRQTTRDIKVLALINIHKL